MKRLLAVSIALTLALGLIACGNEPTGPEAELVGTWTFEDTDMVMVFTDRFRNYLVDQGLSRTQANEIVNAMFADAEANIRSLRSMIRFNEDNTWEDDSGGRGTWRVEGNELVSSNEDGTVERVEYFLDGDDLTLIITKAWILENIRQDEDFDAEVYELYNTILASSDVLRIFYRRKS